MNHQPMMPRANLLFVLLGVGTSLMQAAILYLLIHRRLRRELPFFTAYTALHVVLVPFSDIAYGRIPYATYFYVFWSIETLTVLLGLLIIREIFLVLFQSYEGARRLAGGIFCAAGVVLLSLTAILAMHGPAEPARRLALAILNLQRSLRFLQVGLMVTLFVLSRYLRLTWRHYVFGIALGFGFFAITNLAMFAVRFYVGYKSSSFIPFVPPVGYFFTVLLWLTYFLQKPPQRPLAGDIPVQNLDKWNDVLADYLKR